MTSKFVVTRPVADTLFIASNTQFTYRFTDTMKKSLVYYEAPFDDMKLIYSYELDSVDINYDISFGLYTGDYHAP